ncbi:hypothetical protein OXPF_40240 [Oxobacter pfennigii]|uniref:DUF5301 domain-containing protein n=1 Tax=Oxobacter pfennigii TaxID=36849 RepID=A0A0N8NSJ9_9CLOT|nr:DUF5301 domain-containing protein [Oxobacter pfennigii]KPU42240.1 hypothetical protein OXPF_40240 [Oxobacter pfennigii]
MNLKKPSLWILTTVVIVFVVIAVFFMTVLMKKLELPDSSDVISMKLEQFNDGETIGGTVITDKEDIETVLAAFSGAKKTMRYSVNDYPTVNDYLIIRFNLKGTSRTLCLYNEWNDYLIEEPYIGIYKYKGDKEKVESIYGVYTRNIAVGNLSVNYDGIIAVSGNKQVPVIVYQSPLDVSLSDIKDTIYYLGIDTGTQFIPFRVFTDGREQFGSYRLYDAETLESIDFPVTSGLAPQAYILSKAQSDHAYIVTLAIGEWNEEGTEVIGDTLVFGIKLL